MFKKSLRYTMFWAAVLVVLAIAIKSFPDRKEEAAAAYNAGEFSMAAKFWRKVAKLGDAEAQYNLGALYASGRGVDASEGEAHKWFLMAAETGNPAAQFEVGKTYETGSGVAPSASVALLWITESAEADYVPAQIDLGLKYLNGTGVKKDLAAATFWLSRAAGSGNNPPIIVDSSASCACQGG